MDFRRLEVFANVAELGSFSRAAEALVLTPPTFLEIVESERPARASQAPA